MKIPKKKRLEIREAINEAYMDAVDEFFPDNEMDNAPDMWDSKTRKNFDMLAIFEAAAQRKVEKVLDT